MEGNIFSGDGFRFSVGRLVECIIRITTAFYSKEFYEELTQSDVLVTFLSTEKYHGLGSIVLQTSKLLSATNFTKQQRRLWQLGRVEGNYSQAVEIYYVVLGK